MFRFKNVFIYQSKLLGIKSNDNNVYHIVNVAGQVCYILYSLL